MTIHAHILHKPDAPHLSHLREQLAPVITLTSGDPIDPATTLLIAGRPSSEHLDACSALQSVIIPFAGLPETTRVLMQQHPHITVHNLHHNAIPTAEMAIALLFAVARNLLPADRAFRQHDWTPRYAPLPTQQLFGKTALILGYGAIGCHIDRICRAIGMQVIGIKRHVDDTLQASTPIYTAQSLPKFLPKADVLFIALPLTRETEGMIGAEQLALLPQGAILINIGRAQIVDEWALFHALQSNQLFGAGIDVWYQYPASTTTRNNTPPAEAPFHTLDNIVMSPHRAGGGGNDDIETMRMRALAALLNQAAQGQPLPNRVHLEIGY